MLLINWLSYVKDLVQVSDKDKDNNDKNHWYKKSDHNINRKVTNNKN